MTFTSVKICHPTFRGEKCLAMMEYVRHMQLSGNVASPFAAMDNRGEVFVFATFCCESQEIVEMIYEIFPRTNHVGERVSGSEKYEDKATGIVFYLYEIDAKSAHACKNIKYNFYLMVEAALNQAVHLFLEDFEEKTGLNAWISGVASIDHAVLVNVALDPYKIMSGIKLPYDYVKPIYKSVEVLNRSISIWIRWDESERAFRIVSAPEYDEEEDFPDDYWED